MIEGNPSSMLDLDKDKGYGQYMNRVMLVLQKVSEKLGYDAYYQFGYLNQLRFLGLIDESTQNANTDLIEKYRDRLVKMLSNKNWIGGQYMAKNNSETDISETDINDNFQPIINSLKRSSLKKADEIRTKENTLKILTYFDSEYWYT